METLDAVNGASQSIHTHSGKSLLTKIEAWVKTQSQEAQNAQKLRKVVCAFCASLWRNHFFRPRQDET